MPVIINETEIVVEPPAPAPKTPPPSPSGTRLTPEEVIRVIQRHQQRLARLWAD